MARHVLLHLAVGVCAFFVGCSAVLVASAADYSSSNFISRDPAVTSGGGYATSASYQLWSAFSQPAIGKSTSASNELRAGFLYFLDASPTPTPTPTPTTSTAPPSTGRGSSTQIPSPSPSASPSPTATVRPPSLIEEFFPPMCIGVRRSDLNCDGRVNLQDLSILISRSRPRSATVRALGLIFNDWTSPLPIPVFRRTPPNRLVIQPGSRGAPGEGFAQLEIVAGEERATPQPQPPTQQLSFKGHIIKFFISAGRLFVSVIRSIASLIGF